MTFFHTSISYFTTSKESDMLVYNTKFKGQFQNKCMIMLRLQSIVIYVQATFHVYIINDTFSINCCQSKDT